jgi:hypothetical protein
MSVPTALHAELSEYSFLLRALRTSNTLDVVSHLTNVPASKDEPDFEIQDVSNQGAPHEHTPEALGSVSNIKRKRKLRGGGLGTTSGKSRDTWTRWPLLADDVHVPEWGLEDEIKLLALHSLRQYSPHKFLDPSPEDAGTDADEDDILPPSTVKALTLSSSSHLSSILAIISAHIPLYEKGLQSRLKPVGWESVVDMMGASGLVDEKSV